MNSSLPDAKSIFGRAAEISTPGERAAFLDDACAGHPAVRAEVETLLKALGDAGSFMRSPAAPAGTADYGDAGTEGEGTLIGPYTLREQIGEGGMGLVFVAEQQQPVRRKVALKVIKPGMDTRQVVARFEAERQALALMDHPNIAKVFDAGVTDAGRPYFVMELVKGAPITEYADANNLTPKDRLGLFVQVCQAVQHAHQKGVIHRDLKPSNILVAPHDGIPVVKVIDFGVAKALGQSLTEKTIYTRFAQMIGTPLYMSPEQAEVNQLDVDTRSDVYSLGVLLYELLTGTTPFDGDRFHKAAFDEIRRIIKEEEPPRPSTRLTSLGVTLTAVSAKRGTDPGQLAGLVRGELDWIVMRCLEKDRTRRYDTAIGLAKDVERYLNGDAVEACPPTLGYRLTKAYRKHRNPIRVGLAFALLFALGTVVSIVSAVQARRAERIADQRRAESEENARVARENGDRAEREAENVRAEQDRTRRLLYASQMSAASAALADNRIQLVVRKLEETTPKPGEPDLRGWEWHYLDRLTRTGREYTLDSNPFDEGNPAVSQLRRTLTPNAKPSRWLVTSRPHGAGDVYVIVDALSGQRVAQVPKDSAIARPAKASGLTWRAVVSDDGRYLLLTEMPASFESKVAAKVARLRAWEIATGQEVVGLPDAIPVTYAVNRGPILGPDAAWVAWVERPGLNLSDENSRPDGGMGLRPNGAAGPVEIAVCRWERGVGMLPPKKFSVGTGTGALSLAPDGRTVFWLPAVPNDISIGARSGPLTFECWDTAGDPKRRWSVEIPGVRNSFPAYRRVVTRFSPSRTMVGFHNQGDMVIHRIADASIHWRVPLPASLQLEAGGLQYYVSDDGNRVVICGEGTITVLEKLGKSPTARPVSWSIHYRPGWDIWDPVGDHSVGDIFQLLPDGQTLIGFTRSGATVRVWDVARDPQGGPVATALPEPREPLVHGGWPMTERATADGRITVRYRGYSRSDRGLPVGQAPPIAVTTRDAEGKEIGRFELPGGSHPGRAPRIDFVDNDRRLLVRTFQETTDEDPQLRTGWKGTEWALYDLETPGRVDRIAGGSGFFSRCRIPPTW
ncbi:MAG: serine/threonine-protein kinase [Gemmataceae bacterium]